MNFEVYKDFNTKDWVVYDNVTNTDVCFCDTEEEANRTMCDICATARKWKVFDLDIWGNELDGWELNHWTEIGKVTIWNFLDDVEYNSKVVITALINAGFLSDTVTASDLYINEYEGFMELCSTADGMPIYTLEEVR